MKRYLPLVVLLSVAIYSGCQQATAKDPVKPISFAELSEMANAVASEGPREGNNYQVFFLALRQNQAAAVNFKVDAYVKGKSKPITVRTDERGLAKFDNLPFPDRKHQLVCTLHYYTGDEDSPREITYPFISSDAYRLKDVQFIPNTVTPDPS